MRRRSTCERPLVLDTPASRIAQLPEIWGVRRTHHACQQERQGSRQGVPAAAARPGMPEIRHTRNKTTCREHEIGYHAIGLAAPSSEELQLEVAGGMLG